MVACGPMHRRSQSLRSMSYKQLHQHARELSTITGISRGPTPHGTVDPSAQGMLWPDPLGHVGVFKSRKRMANEITQLRVLPPVRCRDFPWRFCVIRPASAANFCAFVRRVHRPQANPDGMPDGPSSVPRHCPSGQVAVILGTSITSLGLVV